MAYPEYRNNGFKGNNNYSKENEQKIKLEFLEKGFTDTKGNLREELITIEALEIAKFFKGNKLSNSQLRAFYNEIKAINNRLENNKENFDKIYPMILMIKPKIEYRASKDRNMSGYKDFLNAGIKHIQEENANGKGFETFKNFVIFFEAVVGYCYGEGIVK